MTYSFKRAAAFFAVGFAAYVVAGSAPASAGTPEDMNFTITKDGKPIGTHTFKFSGNEKNLKVDVETHTKVQLLFLKFTYDHQRSETWAGGRLVGLSSKTNDDGTNHEMNIAAGGQGISGIVNGKDYTAPGPLPVTLWNAEILNKPVLFSALDGIEYKLEWKNLGREEITIGGKNTSADVYQMSGDLERKLWYSPDGQFLKTAFKKKGYDIEWVRE